MIRSTLATAIALAGVLANGIASAQDAAATGAVATPPVEERQGVAATGPEDAPKVQDADGDGLADAASRRRAKGKARHGFGKPATKAAMSGPPSNATAERSIAGDPIPGIDITVGAAAQDGDKAQTRDEDSVPALDPNPIP